VPAASFILIIPFVNGVYWIVVPSRPSRCIAGHLPSSACRRMTAG